ncbi:MAG: Crp/Fnr family transcriptional regulator [Bacteroidota bacterium]|nr:Crp/Fnr family transcriptional regulator [Bacteroidota bacterium]MDP4204544.1 Crp/Fnr family transcriptional regulator [Bacteroidota bacterium]
MLNFDSDYKDYLEEGVSFLDLLTPEEKAELDKHIICTNYKKNEFIYKEGEPPIGMLYLSEGKVKIFKEGVCGREQIIRMAKPLGLIGFRALFANELHQASAVAIEDSVICSISSDFIFKSLLKNPDFSAHIIKLLAKELGFSNLRTISLTQKHIRGRLAESLIILKEKYGFESDNVTLKVYLSREDIASLSNMTTSNAIRTLSTFANEKVITIDGRKIKILDPNKLERISKLG